MKLNGSQIVMEVLLDQGVDTVFGYPGGTILNIYDELYKYSDKIHHIITAHEQGAAHAADGYARATGKVGVVMSTSGPGATNLVTGLATANMDSIPVVAICANVADTMIGKDSFQEISITSVTMPITKHNFFVNDIDDLEDSLREAFSIAMSGRKGPVLVDITKDVTAAVTDFERKGKVALRSVPKIEEEDIKEIASLINESERPVIYGGGGLVSSGATKEVLELMEKADIPLVHTLMACGIVGENPRDYGLVGMHGKVSANRAIDQADLVLAFGSRFSDRVALDTSRFAHRAKIVQVDIDISEIHKNVVVDKYAIADLKDFIKRIIPLVKKKKHKEWIEQLDRFRDREKVVREGNAKLHPYDVMEALNEVAGNSIFVTDVGQHQMWAAQYLKHKDARHFLTSGGLGTMGYGYGAAIGAKCGKPKERVIHITGDGSFHMNLNEACTAVSNNLPIITVIINNRVLGMVYQWQTLFYEKRYSNTILERKTDYVKVIEGFGGTGFRASTPEEFKAVLKKAMKCKGPVWIDCQIDREERVLPMIPGGKSIDHMIVD